MLQQHSILNIQLNGWVLELCMLDMVRSCLTLSPPSATEMSYAKSFDLDETPSDSASHPDQSCLTLRQRFRQL